MPQPTGKILRKYASVLVNFALASGDGMKKNETVLIATQTPGIPLAREVYRAVVRSGGNPLMNIIDDEVRKILLTEGSDPQIGYFPEKYYRGLAGTIDPEEFYDFTSTRPIVSVGPDYQRNLSWPSNSFFYHVDPALEKHAEADAAHLVVSQDNDAHQDDLTQRLQRARRREDSSAI